MKASTRFFFGAFVILSGCADGAAERSAGRGTAVDHGRLLYADAAASPSPSNAFACATCHPIGEPSGGGRRYPGAPLGGAIARRSYWGGAEDDLLSAINQCRVRFMGAQDPWTADDLEARALWAYLESLPAETEDPVPFTVVTAVEDIPEGSAKEGAGTYSAACAPCHGRVHTGEGRLTTRAPRLPDDTLAEHADEFSPTEQRVVFVEKTRHGGFLGYGGNMPPFSREVLGDRELGGLLAYLGLY